MKILLCIVLFWLVACGGDGSKPITMELEDIENDTINSWLNLESNELKAIWGPPAKEESENGYSKLTYVINNMEDAFDTARSKNLEQGPKTQGIDNDLLKVIRETILNSCTAVFLVDKDYLIKQARLQRFKGANECATSKIYPPRPLDNGQ